MKFFGRGTFDQKQFDTYCTCLGLNRIRRERAVDKESEAAQTF